MERRGEEEGHGCEWFPTFSITYRWISSSVHVQSPLGVHLTRFSPQNGRESTVHWSAPIITWPRESSCVRFIGGRLSRKKKKERSAGSVGRIRDQKPEKIGSDVKSGRIKTIRASPSFVRNFALRWRILKSLPVREVRDAMSDAKVPDDHVPPCLRKESRVDWSWIGRGGLV